MLNLKLWHTRSSDTPEAHADEQPPATAPRPLMRIVVLNTKGGCGKTTLSTNLAGYYASHRLQHRAAGHGPPGLQPALARRTAASKAGAITGLAAPNAAAASPSSFQMRVPPETERLIVDTPAAIDSLRLQDSTRGAHAIIIPVLPSDIDIHAASRCIADLLLDGPHREPAERVAVVANRVKKNTRMYETLAALPAQPGYPLRRHLPRHPELRACDRKRAWACMNSRTVTSRKMRDEWDVLIEWLETPALARSQHRSYHPH